MSSSRTRLKTSLLASHSSIPKRDFGYSGVELVLGDSSKGGLRTRALDVPDDGTGRVVHELDADLGDTSTRT